MKNFLNKVTCVDALEGLKQLPDECVDLVITSPPYNLGVEYDIYNDQKDWNEYFAFLCQVFKEVFRVLKPNRRVCINIAPYWAGFMPTHHILTQIMLDIGYKWYTEIIWEKNNHGCIPAKYGSFALPSCPYFLTTWEFVEVYAKGKHKREVRKQDADISPEEFKKWHRVKWVITPENKAKELGHPAPFPVELPLRLMKLLSYKGDMILDPFAGVGSTGVASITSCRRFIGFDISKKYCLIANKRIKDVLAQRRLSQWLGTPYTKS